MFDPKLILAIAFGGSIGAVTRHIAATWLQNLSGGAVFPWGILIVNVTGCLLIGAIVQYGESTGHLSPGLRALLITGFLGGYTTYSTFASQSFDLAADGLGWISLAYIALTVLGGLAAVWLGRLAVVRLMQ